MCLSTVYKNVKSEETVVMRNVVSLTCQDGMVILTDLMDRQYALEAVLERADLVDGVVLLRTGEKGL